MVGATRKRICFAGFCRVWCRPRKISRRQSTMSGKRASRSNWAPSRAFHYRPDTQRLLRATNDYFCAGAVFKRQNSIWSISSCAPCLAFLRGLDPASAKLELTRRGFSWSWVESSPCNGLQSEQRGVRIVAASDQPVTSPATINPVPRDVPPLKLIETPSLSGPANPSTVNPKATSHEPSAYPLNPVAQGTSLHPPIAATLDSSLQRLAPVTHAE